MAHISLMHFDRVVLHFLDTQLSKGFLLFPLGEFSKSCDTYEDGGLAHSAPVMLREELKVVANGD